MSKWRIVVMPSAEKDLDKLDRVVRTRVIKKLSFFEAQPNPLLFAKKLTDLKVGEYRFRIGKYRAAFDVVPGTTVINLLRVDHRRTIYR